ncbi:hypothetical protein CDL15_Pgr024592 [Punica granatum]|uniref:YTH domain-containing family protein n=1 Tax=Punica granatum TaxID=22663 RepID=A0A218XXV5_PUNGR|nr:hypothetical protein CDL15_Pgr024592 [Punica granatum]
MAAVAPPADRILFNLLLVWFLAPIRSVSEAADLLQKLSLDAQPKPLEIPEPTKKPTANQYGPVDSANAPNGHIPPYERSLTPLLHDFTDPTMCYLPNGYPSTAYYYGGYDGTGNEWDDFSRYGNAEGVDLTSGFYGDNGSIMYPGYGFAPYGPYSPAASPVPGNEQLYGTQHYHYPSPYFQSLPTSVPNAPNISAPQMEVSTSAPTDQKPLPVETLNGNSNGPKSGGAKGNARSGPLKATHPNSGYNANGSFGIASLPGGIASGYQDVRFGYDGLGSPISWSDGPAFADVQSGRVTNTGMANSISNAKSVPSSRNQNYRPNSHIMGLHHARPLSGVGTANGFINRLYPNKLYGQYGSTVRSGMGFGYDSRTNGRGWLCMDNKYKNRGHGSGFYGYGNENLDGLNELNRGPRAKGSKNQKSFSSVTLAVKGQNLPNGANGEEKIKTSGTPDREQYNKADFPEEYADAKFFVIKSYSEDDVHKSIKYNVWASTPNGNKKLDAAYREAQEKAGDCPIFLFFSVNTSGQFVGVAEMMGPVDFQKNVEYWQQDKWNGCFPVKWHIVKDVPNSLLKHIILENNENKPVTNSRDTQEVKLEQGPKMIKIFKEHSSKTCLLDDFEFYENRQKAIQEKKAKHQQYQKQARHAGSNQSLTSDSILLSHFCQAMCFFHCYVWEGKLTSEKKETGNGELKSPKSLEVSSDPTNENATALSNGDLKVPEDPKAVIADKVIANGVANAC